MNDQFSDIPGPEKYTGPHRIQMDKWIDCAPFEQLLHMEIVEAADGRALLTMPFLIEFAQGGGLMHGGALVSLADTAVVMAIKSLLPPMTHFATISMETRFFYPVKQGIVKAEAQITDREDRILRGKAVIRNEDDRDILEFMSVFKIAKDRLIR